MKIAEMGDFSAAWDDLSNPETVKAEVT